MMNVTTLFECFAPFLFLSLSLELSPLCLLAAKKKYLTGNSDTT